MPLVGKVNWKPLNEMLWLATNPDTPDGAFGEPAAMVRDASVEYPLASTRLVMEIGRNTFRLPVTCTPGEPEHTRTISPSCSVKPSECTILGVAAAVHVVGFWAFKPRQNVKKSMPSIGQNSR